MRWPRARGFPHTGSADAQKSPVACNWSTGRFCQYMCKYHVGVETRLACTSRIESYVRDRTDVVRNFNANPLWARRSTSVGGWSLPRLEPDLDQCSERFRLTASRRGQVSAPNARLAQGALHPAHPATSGPAAVAERVGSGSQSGHRAGSGQGACRTRGQARTSMKRRRRSRRKRNRQRLSSHRKRLRQQLSTGSWH